MSIQDEFRKRIERLEEHIPEHWLRIETIEDAVPKLRHDQELMRGRVEHLEAAKQKTHRHSDRHARDIAILETAIQNTNARLDPLCDERARLDLMKATVDPAVESTPEPKRWAMTTHQRLDALEEQLVLILKAQNVRAAFTGGWRMGIDARLNSMESRIGATQTPTLKSSKADKEAYSQRVFDDVSKGISRLRGRRLDGMEGRLGTLEFTFCKHDGDLGKARADYENLYESDKAAELRMDSLHTRLLRIENAKE